jgi:LTXXQ motif family protein
MQKSILAVTTAVIVAGSAATYAVAQQPPAPPKPGMENQWRPSPADHAAFAGARVAALHAGLALTPEQEKLWPPVESVLKDLAQKHEARMEERRAEREKSRDEKQAPDAMMRLRKGADFMIQTGADLKRLADAAQPLYDKLDDSQKHRLQMMVERRMFERQGMRERVMHRFSEWRDRYDHWRNDDGPRGRDRDRDDRPDRGPDSGERL